MRLLLDENFPVDFAVQLTGHEVLTVHSLGWEGTVNGELLRRAKGNCDVFVTLDQNIEVQQNIKILTFGIVVVRAFSNRLVHLTPHVAAILEAAGKVQPGTVETAGI